jgi:hypothetical protein
VLSSAVLTEARGRLHRIVSHSIHSSSSNTEGSDCIPIGCSDSSGNSSCVCLQQQLYLMHKPGEAVAVGLCKSCSVQTVLILALLLLLVCPCSWWGTPLQATTTCGAVPWSAATSTW